MNKIDKLCKKLELEAELEGKSVEDEDICDKSFNGFECTRPMKHSGFHISMRMGPNIVAMWHEDISD